MENYFKKASFIKTVVAKKEIPSERKKEILFVGKSNVGKSTLINSLVNNKRLAKTSSHPGHTKYLNYYLVEDRFYLVDCPGYGFSERRGKDYKIYADLVEDYFDNNEYLQLVVFLLDSRHLPTDDDYDFYQFLLSTNYNFIICMTKCDKLNMSMKAKISKNLKEKLDINEDEVKVFLTSKDDVRSISSLKNYIETVLEG